MNCNIHLHENFFTRVRTLHIFLLSLPFTLSLGACQQDNSAAPGKEPTMQLRANAELGTYLIDSLGNTLYSFANDFDGQNNCSGGCAEQWPIYYAGDHLLNARFGAGLKASDFGTITTSAGYKQTTYKKWPLYYYAPVTDVAHTREAPGMTRGEGSGGVWHVAKPDYTSRLMNADEGMTRDLGDLRK